MMFAHRTEQELRRTSARNALESYECQMRSELEQDLANFATQEERTTLLQKCEDINIWLYEDGEKETRQVYADKLSDLESIGEKIKFRASEYDRRKPVVGNMERYINVRNVDHRYS